MMKNIFTHITTFLFVGIFFSLNAYAQQGGAPKAKKTTVNFEDQLIEGQASKPDLLYLLQKKKFNYKKLIRLRENFLPELRQTGNEIAPAKRSKEK
jgi:hypothetical protein